MGIFTPTRRAPKNDGLPFVNGKKVTANHGRFNTSSSRRGSSKVEGKFEKFTQKKNMFNCSNHRVWYFGVGVVVAVCLYISQTYSSMIPTNKEKSNNNTTITTTTTNGMIPKTVGMNKEAIEMNNVPAVPDIIIDAAVVTIPPSPVVAPETAPEIAPETTPETAPVPVDDAVPVPLVVPLPAVTTTTCTAEQRELVLHQLPNSKECGRGYHPSCSFRMATSGCQNPILARTFFADTNDFKPVASSSSKVPIPFTAVIVRWGNNNIPLDLLQIGSGLDSKYDTDWEKQLAGINTHTCRTHIKTTTTTTKKGEKPTRLPPQVVVIDWESPTSSVLHELNKKYHDQDLMIEDINIKGGAYLGKKNSLTKLIQSKLGVSNPESKEKDNNRPIVIHYLDLVGRAGGYDYDILMELLPELLQHVRFLHFEYNRKFQWSAPSKTLEKLIAHLKTNGLICYWSGDEKAEYGLWRITDCFLDHYKQKNWSRIQCVSGIHPDVKELATRMETQFLTTIQRKNINISFSHAS